MKYLIENENIRNVLDELSEEYKDLLIKKTLEDHQFNNLEEIPISALVKLDISTKKYLTRSKKQEKNARLLNIISAMGLFYSLLSVFMLIIVVLGNDLINSSLVIIALTLFVTGISIAFSCLLARKYYINKKHSNKEKKDYLYYEIILLWKHLESIMLQLSSDKKMVSTKALIRELMDNRYITSQEVQTILDLYLIRNRIVHTNQLEQREISSEEYLVMANSRKLIQKLRKVVN